MNITVRNCICFLIIIFLLLPYQTSKAKEGRFTLFSCETKSLYPSVVYDFLERYLYELDSIQRIDPVIQPRLINDKVLFLKGSPAIARELTPSTPFTLRITENQFYEAIWSDTTLENELLHIVFPISYELIQGKPKHIIEKEMKQQLMSLSDSFVPDTLSLYENIFEVDSDCYCPESIMYLDGIESLNTGTYYRRTDKGTLCPVFDKMQSFYSAANLFQGVISDIQNYKLHILQQQYDFKKEEYLISLSQWLNYCKLMHVTVYVGLEDELKEGLKLLLIAHSHDLGFQHMMSIIVPWNFVEKRDVTIKALFNAFIPIHNVKTMYMEKLKDNFNQ